ncbi:MAG: DUF262 domain-containing protein [Methylobacteriaceae bacterium]|nr:DUF262 domain-containing protein [Methylobacteriaceae bacterium]
MKPSSAREVSRLLVIDGQQRLTTLQLLLCAFRDLASQRGWTSLERRVRRYVENADADVMENPEEEVFKLWPTQLNRDVFANIVRAESRLSVEKSYPLVRRKYQRQPDARSPLVEAYLFFSGQIENWISDSGEPEGKTEEDRAFALLQALQQDFCVVEIALAEGDDSQEISYSLNSQGQPLSQSDLLRSLIFMRAEKEKEDRDALFADYWNVFETPFWSTEVKRGGRTYSRLDLALRHFLTVKTGSLIDTRRVNEEYRRWIAGVPAPFPSVRAELADFCRYAEAIKAFEGIPAGAKSTNIARVLQDLDISTAIPLVLFLKLEANLSEEQLLACFAVLESFVVRRAFNGDETKEYNKLFVEIVSSLRGRTAAEVKPALEAKLLAGGGTTRAWPTNDEILERALSSSVYERQKQPMLRLIFERLELRMRGKKSEDQEIPPNLQIEHVMPQSWYAHWPVDGNAVSFHQALYPSTLDEEQIDIANAIRTRNSVVNTPGNLTLLNQYLNPAASNGTFELKRSEYGPSVLRLNRYFDGRSEWNEAAIRERGRILGEMISAIWTRPQPNTGPAQPT